MRILLKGSRFECKRDSLEAGSIDELYGPPVAVPFKWEESPGKAKPVEKDPVLQIEGGDEFYNKLLRKEGSIGRSSGSLYKTVAHGTVPFNWEDEPGKPKTPTREELEYSLAPLSPPPFLQSPCQTSNSFGKVQRPTKTTPKRFAKKMMKSIFQGMFVGVSKPACENNNHGNLKHRSHESANSFDSACLGSDELGASESISRNGSSSFKTSSVDYTSEFSNVDEACRISDSKPRCFARCPMSLPRNLSRPRNSASDQSRNPSDLKTAYFSMVTCMRQLSRKNSSVVVDTAESLHQEGGLEFQDAVTDFVAAAENSESCEDHNRSNPNHDTACCNPGEMKDESSAIRRANATIVEAELLIRLGQEDVTLKMVNSHFHSQMLRIFLACLPLCALAPARRPKLRKNERDSDQR